MAMETLILPMCETRYFRKLEDGNRLPFDPTVHCQIDGCFLKDASNDSWSCHRRLYFDVTNCSYSCSPFTEALYLSRADNRILNGSPEFRRKIQGFGMIVTARDHKAPKKKVPIRQYSPETDAMHKVPVVILPLLRDVEEEQTQDDSAAARHRADQAHAFEKLMFKAATAYNNTRKARRQHFEIVVELWATCDRIPLSKRYVSYTEVASSHRWMKVAQRHSEPFIVRERNPIKYLRMNKIRNELRIGRRNLEQSTPDTSVALCLWADSNAGAA